MLRSLLFVDAIILRLVPFYGKNLAKIELIKELTQKQSASPIPSAL